MGDISEMMLDGTLCETCGEFIGEPVGYPRYCGGCRPRKKKNKNKKKNREGKKDGR